MIIEAPGLYSVSEAAYHADPAPEPSLSRGCICDLLYASPRHAWTKHPRLNPAWVAEDDSKFDLGSAAHDALLCGMERVQPLDYPDYRTKAAREARAQAVADLKLPVLSKQFDAIQEMVGIARAFWTDVLDPSGAPFGDGMTEISAFWREGLAWCRARFDWLANDRRLIVDYKSTLGSAAPEVWAHQHVVQDGLDIQASWYQRAAIRTNEGPIAKSDFVFLVQECTPPYACSLVGLDRAFEEMGLEKCERGLELWRNCRELGQWPGYAQRIHWASPSSWNMSRWEEIKMAEEFTA